jgi:RimJ/RimL family protein N-acetyltransferase
MSTSRPTRPATLVGSSPPDAVGTTTRPETVGELIAIYLRPQLWRLGIGGQLHAAGVAGLSPRFEQATLCVLDGSARSRAFYERQGWQSDGTVKRDTIGDAEVVEVRYPRPLNSCAPKS